MFSAAMVNAEAGPHAVPSDPREWEAALRAADSCWCRFPYLSERYGERGLRFTRSDAAWLATLIQFDPPLVVEKVTWLRGVLATRGIPSVVLQTQLEMLADELGAALPDGRTGRHGRLREAAAGLREARRTRISDEQIALLAEEFDVATEACSPTRVADTPLLLATAVVDEIDGNPGAVSSLAGWLTNPQCFPVAWRAAVERAQAQACAYAGISAQRVWP